jgi:hypothetical protein
VAATAVFASKEVVQYAARCLNGVEHMGMKLSVRMDKEATAVGQATSDSGFNCVKCRIFAQFSHNVC